MSVAQEPDDLEWTVDGFVASVPEQDVAQPARMAIASIALGMGLSCGALVFMLLQGFENAVGLFMVAWLLSFFGGLGMFRVQSWRRQRVRVRLRLDAGTFTWNRAESDAESVCLVDVRELRVRGPRPWHIVLKTEKTVHVIELGDEGPARWIADQLGVRIRAFRGHAGRDSDIPAELRRVRDHGVRIADR